MSEASEKIKAALLHAIQEYRLGETVDVEVAGRAYIEDTVMRLNGRSQPERCRAAWALISNESSLPSQGYAEEHVTDARFYVGSVDGESFIGINARLHRPIESVTITFELEPPLDEPLCSECGLTQGDAQANHRPAGAHGLGGPVREDGYYPHPFKARV